jgi:hypothetical protein
MTDVFCPAHSGTLMKLDDHEKRLDGLDKRVGELVVTIDVKVGDVHERIDALILGQNKSYQATILTLLGVFASILLAVISLLK